MSLTPGTQINLLKKEAVDQISDDLESAVETHRNQAELAAIAAGATLYDSTSNGLSGTSDGDVFLVATTPGVQVYRNDAGSATALGWLGEVLFDDVGALLADTGSYAEGTIIRTRAEGFSYEAIPAATATSIANAGGQNFEVLPDKDGSVNILAFNADKTGATDSTAAFNKALLTERKIRLPHDGSFSVSDITPQNRTDIEGDKYQISTTAEFVVNTNDTAVFYHNTESNLTHFRLKNVRIRAANGVTGAKVWRQEFNNYYTAYARFENLSLSQNLECSFEGRFLIFKMLSCTDGFEGGAVPGQSHCAVRMLETDSSTARANIGFIENCRFIRQTDTAGSLQLELGKSWHITGCDWAESDGPLLYGRGLDSVTFRNNYSERCGTTSYIDLGISAVEGGARGFVIDSNFCKCDTGNQQYVRLEGATSGIVTNNVFSSPPTGMQMLGGSGSGNVRFQVGNISLTSAPADFFDIRSKPLELDLAKGSRPSPQMRPINVMPLGKSLGAANFTTDYGTISDAPSLIGAHDAIEFTMTGGGNFAYYDIPSLLLQNLLLDETVTLTASVYHHPANTTNTNINILIWEDVSTPDYGNATVISDALLFEASDGLVTGSINHTVGSTASTLRVGWRTGAGSGLGYMDQMKLFLGITDPLFSGFE